MSSASSSSAKHLFADSKRRLAARITVNVNNTTSVARQIVRGSKSNETLMKAARDFAQTEATMENSYHNLKKIELIRGHIGFQYDAMLENAEKLEYLHEQMQSMER